MLRQADAVPQEVAPAAVRGRLDLRDKLIFTIDGDDAKDFDDAVSLEPLENGHYLLGVHIADVSHYVTPGSPLDQEAYRRGTSDVYKRQVEDCVLVYETRQLRVTGENPDALLPQIREICQSIESEAKVIAPAPKHHGKGSQRVYTCLLYTSSIAVYWYRRSSGSVIQRLGTTFTST